MSLNFLTSGSVRSGMVATPAVFSGQIGSGVVASGHLASGLLANVTVGSGGIGSGLIASGAVPGYFGPYRAVMSGTIGVDDFGSGAIIAGTVGSGAIQSGNLASGQVGTNHLSSGSVVSGRMASGQVGNNHLANYAVTSGNVASGAVMGSLISGLTRHVASGTIGPFDLASGTIFAGVGITVTLAASGITITNASGATTVLSGSIGSGAIASGAVQGFFGTTRHVASGTLGVWDFGSGAVIAGAIGSGAAVSGNVASGQIGFGHLANASVQSGTLASGTLGIYHHSSGDVATAAQFVGPFVSGGNWTITVEEPVSGFRAVTISQSGTARIAMASVSGRMPAVGFIAENVASGIAANVWALGTFQLTSGMADFSGWLGQPLVVGRSGQIAAMSGSWNSGGLLSGDALQFVGMPVNSGGAFLTTGTQSVSGHILGSGVVLSGNIGSGQVGRFHVASGQFAGFELGSGAIVSGRVASGQIGFGHLADASVQSGTVVSGQLFGMHLASGAVVSGHVGSGAVAGLFGGTRHIASGTVGQSDLASGAILSGHVGSGAVAGAAGGGFRNIASGTVGTNDIGSGAIISGTVASGVIGFGHLATQSVRGALISGVARTVASGTIGPADLASGTIFAGDGIGVTIALSGISITNLSGAGGAGLTSGAVQSGHIASGAVQGFFGSTRHVASGTLGVWDFGSGAIIATTIGSGAVQSGNIASGQVGTNHIGSGAVVSGRVASGQLADFHFASGARIDSAEWLAENTFVLNEDVSGGKAVCFNQSGQLVAAMASVSGRAPAVGILPTNEVSGATVLIYRNGRLFNTNFNFSGWPNQVLYLGASGDVIASGAPALSGDVVQPLGTSISASGMEIELGDAFVDALVYSGNLASGQISRFALASGAVNSGHVGSGAVQGAAGGTRHIASGTVGTNDIGSGAVVSGTVASGQLGRNHLGLNLTPVVFHPYGNEPQSSGAALQDSRNARSCLTFPNSGAFGATWSTTLPRTYAGDGLTATIQWAGGSGNILSGHVIWAGKWERMASGGTSVDVDSFAAEQTVSGILPNVSGALSYTALAFTNAQIDGLLAGEQFRFRLELFRASGQSISGSAQVFGLEFREP